MEKMCLSTLVIAGKRHHCNRTDPQHDVHEDSGSVAEVVGKSFVIVKRYTIQWTVTEMEMEVE